MAAPFQRIDKALAQHYASCNRNDYFDENGIGKFIRFVKKHAFDENEIDWELGDDVNVEDCLYIEMDPTFPVTSIPQHDMTDHLRNNEMLQILQHCYKYGVPPNAPNRSSPLNSIHRLFGLPQHVAVSWKHIQNAMNHEFQSYDNHAITSSFMETVNGRKRFENINQLLEEMKQTYDFELNEINSFVQLMNSAKLFYHSNHPILNVALRAKHVLDRANDVSDTAVLAASKSDDKSNMVHMNDILAIIRADNATRAMRGVIQYIHDEEYDTDSLIDDLHETAFPNDANTLCVKQKYYNRDEWIRNTRTVVIRMWQTTRYTSILTYHHSNLCRMKILCSNANGLSFNVLHDIYNTHQCFLFANYHFKHYDVNQFINDIQNCEDLPVDTVTRIQTIGIEDSIVTLNLHLPFVIHDNMYKMCKYFVSASHIVQKERQSNNNFVFRVCIVPRHVTLVYNEDVVVPFRIDDIRSFLQSHNIDPIDVKVPDSKDTVAITELLERQVDSIKANRGITGINNILCIVDRRGIACDVLYILHMTNYSFYKYHELNQNYIFELEFDVSINTVRCYLYYGNGRTRFYPEHLTTIIPRFFIRNAEVNKKYTQKMDKLYEHWYQRGFLDLSDTSFSRYYKSITNVELSLNPIHRLLNDQNAHGHELLSNSTTLEWNHIASALNHELYDKISSSFMVVVNGNKRFENMDELLEEIMHQRH
eukprot:983217_1